MNKQKLLLLSLSFQILSCSVLHKNSVSLYKAKWIHGSANCKENKDSSIQVVKYNHNSWILRESKCVTYEAPFLFLFIGKKKALLMDTGASGDEAVVTLYQTVRGIINNWENATKTHIELIVAHTHSHGDHTAGDKQFNNKPKTTVVGLEIDDIKAFFKLENWPLQSSLLDLGDRVMEIIPIPGHHKASIAVYDNETKILLSGDSFYPGRLYIKDWQAFKLSTQRLVDFTQRHKVSCILGNHIEMTKTSGKDYPVFNNFQPNETPLPLTVKELEELNMSLQKMGDKPAKEVHNKFIIFPL